MDAVPEGLLRVLAWGLSAALFHWERCARSEVRIDLIALAFLVQSQIIRGKRMTLPSYFTPLVEYFLVPLGVLMIAYVFNAQFRLKYSAGSDFYVFFVSLDLNAIILYSAYRESINPKFRDDYLTIFVFLVVVCLALLGVTLKVQGNIDKWRNDRMTGYPLTGVVTCWVATVTMIPTHLFVFFGSK